MVSMEQLSMLGKTVMGAAVDAELLGLPGVRAYLDAAFDLIAREAVEVREREVEGESGGLLLEGVGVVDEG